MKRTLIASALLLASITVGIGAADFADAAPGSCTSGTSDGSTPFKSVGLTASGELTCFDLSEPGRGSTIGPVSGLAGDSSLVGIDFRVQDGLLYGVGNAGGLYTLNLTNAAATKVDQLDVALSGAQFGVDFNPVANALRIISDNGQNLRHAFATTTTFTDAPLNNGATPTPAPAPGILGAGYTNNDLVAATATTLFDLNTTNATGVGGSIVVQSTANSGVVVPTGTFAQDAVNGDLDVYTTSGSKNFAYALVVTPSESRFHKVDLLTGQLDKGRRATGLVDIALPINQ